MRIPGLRLRVGLAVAVIATSAAWLLRPLDLSVLIPVMFRAGQLGDPPVVGYINLQGREVFREPWSENRLSTSAVRQLVRENGGILCLEVSPTTIRDTDPTTPILNSWLPRIRGYADTYGQLKYPIAWEKLPVEIELVPVQEGQAWGYMNRANQWVVEPKFTVAEVFNLSGIGVVSLGDRRGAINRSGQLIVPWEYDSIFSGSDRGVTYVNATARSRHKLAWINWCEKQINQIFGRKLPNLTYEESIYDSKGNLICRSSWLFRSWAPVWILLATGWLAFELATQLVRRYRRKLL